MRRLNSTPAPKTRKEILLGTEYHGGRIQKTEFRIQNQKETPVSANENKKAGAWLELEKSDRPYRDS
jgi:hypothetical protein